MADEDITLDGKPLQSLRVADLKAALEQRNLPKSGQKNTLIKRLKGALMLENLQKSSSSHSGLQPNSQIGEEMSQNSFIKQYLAKQQELLRQRLEREAQQEEEADESPAVPEEDEDQSEDNESSSYVSDKLGPKMSQPPLTRTEEKGGGGLMVGHGMMVCGPDGGPGPTLHRQESPDAPGARMQRGTFHQGHKEPPAPSPPRAVASLSVRVLGQPDRQGLPPAVSRAQEKEGTAPSEPGSAHPVLHLSRSAAVLSGGRVPEDSDEDDDDDDESEDDEEWGPGPGPGGARKGNRVPPPPQQMPPGGPLAVARSKRKLQPPQHIPPPQVLETPMQLRHPTPPPSPPPDLFPLPDTPKQSPPDTDNQEGEGPEASHGPRVASVPPSTMQRQDSESSSRSSSPEPPVKRRPGPLSLLVHKMESEGAFRAGETTSAVTTSGETSHSSAGSVMSVGAAGPSESPLQRLERKRQLEHREMEEKRRLLEKKERERKKELEEERKKEEGEKKRLEEEKEKERKRLEEEERRKKRQLEEERNKKQQAANKERMVVTEVQDSGSSSDSDSSSRSSRSSSSAGDKPRPASQLKKAGQGREANDEKKTKLSKGETGHLTKREVSEPSAAAVTEVEPDSESSMAQQPASGAEPDNSEGRLEEVPMPLPLPLMVPAAYYYYHHHQHQHLLHSSSYNSCPAMPKCVAGT